MEAAYPHTRDAVTTIRALHRLPPRDQRSEVSSLRAKLALFRFFPTFKAIFGAGTPGINWQEVVDEGQAVLLDFGQITHAKARKFAYLWVYESFLTFVKQRGYGQHTPISVIIDEVSDLVSNAGVDQDILSGQLNELISILARSHKLVGHDRRAGTVPAARAAPQNGAVGQRPDVRADVRPGDGRAAGPPVLPV